MAAIFGRFSAQSEQTLVETQKLAERLSRPIQTDTFLLALVNQPGAAGAELLKHLGATYSKLIEALPPVEEVFEEPTPSATQQTREMQLMLEEAIKLAARYRFNSVELEHMLYVIAREENLSGNLLLRRVRLDPALIVARLSEWMMSVAAMNSQAKNGQPVSDEPELDKYALDLTDMAEAGELDPVIGREQELEQLIHILLRRRKNNPLLIGEPGVGKTAIVDALAQRIVDGNVPAALRDKSVLLIDLSAIVAGTIYRGQFEERLKKVIEEATDDGNAILFIDEIHTLSGTGSSEGGFDAANILKPALARGDITLIGATTHEEYRKHIRKDKALDRRFQTVQVNEPTSGEAVRMLKGLRRELENHHDVKIGDAAITAAVTLSTRYIHDRFLPDKAIDVLDEAATYHAAAHHQDESVTKLQDEIALVSGRKNEVVERADSAEEWELAKALSEKETQLLNQLKRLHETLRRKRRKPAVTVHDVARVVAARTGVPVSQVEETLEPLDVKAITTTLNDHILGQKEAVDRIAQALMRAQLGLQPENKPMGSFLLVGPTGVGKTETARILAEKAFGSRDALIKVDMSEYMERHAVSNLIGAPAGYVGFDQGGTLTEQVTRRPYSVVLFDEVEKAHPDVFNILLQILEDGTLTDNTGRRTSFAHTLVIMTSNIGLDSWNQLSRIGFSHDEDEDARAARRAADLREHIEGEIKEFFRPELLGRLSAVVHYQPLTEDVVRRLIKQRFEELRRRLRTRKITLQATPSFYDWAAREFDTEAGARSIDRLFLYHVEPAIIDAIIEGAGSVRLSLSAKDGEVSVTATQPNPASV